MRLFVAIPLSQEMQKSITTAMHELKKTGVKGSYVPGQNLHLTLAFIGEVDDAKVVRKALETVSYKPFKLSLDEFGAFQDTLYVGVRGNQGLSNVAKTVRIVLAARGIHYDEKKFVPHITLVRRASGPWKKVTAPKGEMMVKKISLMKTTFKDGKPVYSEVCIEKKCNEHSIC